MGILDRFKKQNQIQTSTKVQFIEERGNGFYSWDGNIYKSDIVRAAIRPKVRAIGKTVAKHLRDSVEGIKVNPEPYMRFLLEEPNAIMTMQELLERSVTQLELNNNAFIYIERDEYDYPIALYPIKSNSVEVLTNREGFLFYRFSLKNGKVVTFKHTDIIHLKKDCNENDIFGDPNTHSLLPLMEIVNVTDQGIVKAVKNSNIIRWLLKFNTALRPEDIKAQSKQFVEDFLSSESESIGAAATDAKMDAQQVKPNDYVPNEHQTKNTILRIYSFFNTNEKIITSSYSEDEWIAYYESMIEPDIIQLSNAFTRKLFNRNQRSYGNKIIFEASNLAFASMNTKIRLVQFVDRGIMNPNEIREILHYPPAPNGDEFIRRLDTAAIKGGENIEKD